MIQAIFFDLDDTLLPSTKSYTDTLDEMQIDLNLFCQARDQAKKNLLPHHVNAHDRLIYFKYYLEQKRQFSSMKCLHLLEEYEYRLKLNLKKSWDQSNLAPLIKDLALKFPLFIITNENLRTQLKKMSIIDERGELFQSLFTSYEFGIEKPNPILFEKILMQTGLSPENCLMVGDNFDQDIKPALAQNMQVLHCHHYTSPPITTMDQKKYQMSENIQQFKIILQEFIL